MLPPQDSLGSFSEVGFRQVPRILDSVTHHDVTTWAMSFQVVTTNALSAQTLREEFSVAFGQSEGLMCSALC